MSLSHFIGGRGCFRAMFHKVMKPPLNVMWTDRKEMSHEIVEFLNVMWTEREGSLRKENSQDDLLVSVSVS